VSSRSRKSVDPNNKQQKWPSPVGLNTMRISTQKIEPLVEKLKKQSDTTFGLVNNPEGLTATVDEGTKAEDPYFPAIPRRSE
jgi:hypothetical protein